MSSSDGGSEEADAVHHRILEMQNQKVNRLFIPSEGEEEASSLSKGLCSNGGGDVGISIDPTPPSTPNSAQAGGKENVDPLVGETYGFDFLFVKRFFRLHGLLFLSYTSLSTLLFMFLLVICLLQEYIVYRVGLIAGGFYKVLADKDLEGFRSQTYSSLGIILAVAFTKSTNQYVQKLLTVTWRQLLCKALHRIYFTDIRYYQLNVLDKSLDNPDQRMTQDVDKFCSTYCEILPKLIISPFVISYYCYQASERSGWLGPVGCFCFFIISTLINKLIMTPIVQYVIKQEKCEGDFRFIHMLVRVNSESIAFLNASGVESFKTDDSLDRLIKTQHRLYIREFVLNFSVNMFDYLGSIFSYLMLAIPIFSGEYDHYSPSELGELISQNAFILIYLIYTFTSLVNTSGKFTDIAGVVHRISQLIEKLNALVYWDNLFPDDYNHRTGSSLGLYDEWITRRQRVEGINGNHEEDGGEHPNGTSKSSLLPAVVLKDVSFSAPSSTKALISNLTTTFSAGESVLIVGPSSAGKSSLLRILRGLWPPKAGTVKKCYPPGPEGVFFCPQKPYLTIGSLREQACFPLKPGAVLAHEDDRRIFHYLDFLRLNSLLERAGGLDNPVSWNLLDSLSPGEMQRLSFLRIFYHRPLIAILDEATSALPLEMEHLIYSECKRLGITTISVGHRASLKQYHDKLLTIGPDGQWTLDPIVP